MALKINKGALSIAQKKAAVEKSIQEAINNQTPEAAIEALKKFTSAFPETAEFLKKQKELWKNDKSLNAEGMVQAEVQASKEASEVFHKVPVSTLQPLTEEEALTQEYIHLQKKYDELEVKDLVTRMETIKKQLAETANEKGPADTTFLFSCNEGAIEFGPRAQVLEIEQIGALLEKLEEKFGADAALSVMKIQITPLKKILTEQEILTYGKKTPGSRSLRGVTYYKDSK